MSRANSKLALPLDEEIVTDEIEKLLKQKEDGEAQWRNKSRTPLQLAYALHIRKMADEAAWKRWVAANLKDEDLRGGKSDRPFALTVKALWPKDRRRAQKGLREIWGKAGYVAEREGVTPETFVKWLDKKEKVERSEPVSGFDKIRAIFNTYDDVKKAKKDAKQEEQQKLITEIQQARAEHLNARPLVEVEAPEQIQKYALEEGEAIALVKISGDAIIISSILTQETSTVSQVLVFTTTGRKLTDPLPPDDGSGSGAESTFETDAEEPREEGQEPKADAVQPEEPVSSVTARRRRTSSSRPEYTPYKKLNDGQRRMVEMYLRQQPPDSKIARNFALYSWRFLPTGRLSNQKGNIYRKTVWPTDQVSPKNARLMTEDELDYCYATLLRDRDQQQPETVEEKPKLPPMKLDPQALEDKQRMLRFIEEKGQVRRAMKDLGIADLAFSDLSVAVINDAYEARKTEINPMQDGFEKREKKLDETLKIVLDYILERDQVRTLFEAAAAKKDNETVH